MANLLTGLRLLLIIPVAWAIAEPGLLSPYLLLLMLVLAVLSDYFDGIVARARGTASPGGQLFDHGTDFLFVTCGIAAAASVGYLSMLLPILIAVAFSQYVLDSYFLFRQKQLRMSMLGRWNGILYFVPAFVVTASRLPVFAGASELLLQALQALGALLILTTFASIIDRALAPLRQRSRQP